MKIDRLIQVLNIDDSSFRKAQEAHDRAIKKLKDALHRLEEDTRERQRIRDIADLIDAEDALYDEAIAALHRGDHDRALPLLELTAKAGIGEAAWLLAGVLEERGQTAEAIIWYQQAAADGDSRADAILADLYSRRSFIIHKPLPGKTGEPPVAPADSRLDLSLEALSVNFEPHDAIRTLWTPYHGTDASACGRLMWAAGVLFVEGQSDARTLQRWLAPDRIKVVPTNGLSRVLDFGLDAAQADDHRLYLYQIKLAKKLLRYCRDSHHDPFIGGAIGGTVTSWQVEHIAAQGFTASDVMTPLASLTTLTPDTTVHHAMEQVLQAGAHALLVCEEDQVVGVVTLADLARCVHDNRGILSIERVETLMRSPATVGMAAPVSVIRALLARESTGLVVVTGPGGMTVGCVAAQSLLAPETARAPKSSRAVPLLRPGKAVVTRCV